MTQHNREEPDHDEIAYRAYLLYEAHGFEEGNDLDHWLAAERQVLEERNVLAPDAEPEAVMEQTPEPAVV